MAIWYGWNNTCATSTTNGWAWGMWNSSIDNSTSASTSITWNQWVTTSSGTTSSSAWQYWTGEIGSTISTINYPEPTEEEREVARIASEERERQRKEAEERAEKILIENLDEEQKKAYAEHKIISIATVKGRKYLIKKGRTGNVYRIDEQGKEVERFCIHPEEYVPDQDTMLSQLLWLRWCEDEFLRVANMTRLAA